MPQAARAPAPQPSILKRDDRQALLYRGQINGVHGDSGLGKGWVALFAAAEQLRAGSTVLMLDLEDVASSIIGRLRLLGVNDQALHERFIYIRPQAAFDRLAVEHLVQIVSERHPALVIIDSLGEAFGLEGIDENHDSEVGPWLRRVPRRLADVTDEGYDGPAVLIVDHVTKVNDNPPCTCPGRSASERRWAAPTLAAGARAARPTRAGRL
jgi:predicted ATP-dependent serine protease